MVKLIVSLLFFLLSKGLYAQEEPRSFLPDLFRDYPNVRDIAISPDGNEIYFTVDDIKSRIAVIAFITKKDDKWSQPKTVSFTGNYRDIEPAFSYTGNRLYFVSNRPVDEYSIEPKDYDIWYVDRIGSGWSIPKNMGTPVNTEADEYYPSITKKGNIFFTAARKDAVGREDIFVSRLKDGDYQEPVSIPGEVNTKYYEFNAFVSPDEEYIIFSSQRPNEGLGLDFCPFVDSKTARLYFTSQKTEVKKNYEKTLNLEDFLFLYRSGKPKGLNRLYSIDLKETIKIKK
jgi:Tol biopolymer transport system component